VRQLRHHCRAETERGRRHRGPLHKQEIDGAGIFDITAEVSSCKTARRIIRISTRENNNPCVRYRDGLPSGARNPCRVIGFTCRSRQTGDESSATRCTRKGGRVVRWTSGA